MGKIVDKWFVLVVCGFLGLIFLVGAWVGKNTTNSEMYHRDYKTCISDLPRNKDCEADYIVFKVVDNE